MERKKILTFEKLKVQFQVRGNILNTIRNVSFDIYDNELVAIVGESGSGKSVLTKAITSMLDANGYIKSGAINYFPIQVARDNEATNFREPIDFVDIHKSLVTKSSKNKFIKIINKKVAILNKELDNLKNNKINENDLDHVLVVMSEKLDKLMNNQTKFSYKNINLEKINKLKTKIAKNVWLKKIINDEELKNKEIAKIEKRIKKLSNEISFYCDLSDEKKLILKKASNIFSGFIENNNYDINAIDELNSLIENQEIKYNYEKKIINLIDSIKLNNNVDIDELYLIINKEKYICNSTKKNRKQAKEQVTKLRGATVAVIPQDPMTSLNPLLSVGKQISEVLIKHEKFNKKQAKAAAIKLLEEVGIDNAKKRYNDIPGEYSGGMRQRVVIAISLACAPRILVCDEPTTALDVTVQANILKLIKSLQAKHGFTTIFITHDLGVVANIADRVAVMYAGQIVEYGTTKEIFYNPKHPYTWALLSSLPQLGEKGEDLYTIVGNPPSLKGRIDGDAFAPRNEFALEIDYIYEPPMYKISETHYAKTWLLDERAEKIKLPKSIENLKKNLK